MFNLGLHISTYASLDTVAFLVTNVWPLGHNNWLVSTLIFEGFPFDYMSTALDI